MKKMESTSTPPQYTVSVKRLRVEEGVPQCSSQQAIHSRVKTHKIATIHEGNQQYNMKKFTECLAQIERAAFASSKYGDLYQDHASLVDETNYVVLLLTKNILEKKKLHKEIIEKIATLVALKTDASNYASKSLEKSNLNLIKSL